MTSVEPLGELALQDDAFVDDGSDAFEQVAAGTELSVLRAGWETMRRRATPATASKLRIANDAHRIALLSRLGRYCDSPEYHGPADRPAP